MRKGQIVKYSKPQPGEEAFRFINVLLGDNPWAQNAIKTHCKHGHPFDRENIYLNPRGERQCRECQRRISKAWYQKRTQPIPCPAVEQWEAKRTTKARELSR